MRKLLACHISFFLSFSTMIYTYCMYICRYVVFVNSLPIYFSVYVHSYDCGLSIDVYLFLQLYLFIVHCSYGSFYWCYFTGCYWLLFFCHCYRMFYVCTRILVQFGMGLFSPSSALVLFHPFVCNTNYSLIVFRCKSGYENETPSKLRA